MEPQETAAREAIRDLLARYALLVDRSRLDEVLELFAEDATLEAGDQPPVQGRTAIRAVFAAAGARIAATASPPLIRHHVTTIVIDLAGPDAAAATSYFLAVTERGPDHWGRYQDRLARRDGRWLIQHRRVRMDGRAAGSVLSG